MTIRFGLFWAILAVFSFFGLFKSFWPILTVLGYFGRFKLNWLFCVVLAVLCCFARFGLFDRFVLFWPF